MFYRLSYPRWLKPRPEPGLGWRMCFNFARKWNLPRIRFQAACISFIFSATIPKRKHLKRFEGLLARQGQNLALTILHVP